MKARGFNYVEYLVTLFVLSLATAIVVPGVVSLQRSEESTDFRLSLSNLVLKAREYAIVNQTAVELSFDGENNLTWAPIEEEVDENGVSLSTDELQERQTNRTVTIPENVQFTVFQVFGRDTTQSDWVFEINHEGSADQATLEFEQNRRPFYFRINAERGLPTLTPGRLADEPAQEWDAGEIELRG